MSSEAQRAAERARHRFERLSFEVAHPPFHAHLGLVPVRADHGEVVIRLPFKLQLSRSSTEMYFHGGVLSALVDVAAHAAIAVELGRTVPTIDLRVDFLRPAPGIDLFAYARATRIGRSVGRADVEVRSGDGEPVLVLGRGTFSTFEDNKHVKDREHARTLVT